MKTPNTKCEYANNGEYITALGKFEGEPVFAPYFWNLGLEGLADDDNGTVYTFKFKHSVNTGRDKCQEFAEWPELEQWLGRKRTLHIVESEQGFVHCY